MKIDKENAPDNVVWVKAFLSRQGYDSISGAMNLLSDSTADILLEDIQAGEWHLKVDASDSANVVLYTGETDIMIFAGFTTQVNLVLHPTGAGTGNVYIWVTWGIQPPGNWMDFQGNPILSPSGNYWDYSGVQQPRVLIDGNLIRMYYTSQGSAYSGYAGLAISTDGINWTHSPNNPVLSHGPGNTWDGNAVAGATVFKDENGYKMYYSGWATSNSEGPWHIGLATSTDGINWVKHPNPVIYASGGAEFQIAPSCILKISDVYYLYYYGRNLPYLDIRLATSPDGINWTKDPANPFFTKQQTYNNWASYKIAYPFFIRINNKDRIYYTGIPNSGPYKIGFVTR